MPYCLPKRVNNESKTSPLKAVSPIIRKYDGHRQKRIKFCRELENDGSQSSTKPAATRSLKAILPKPSGGEVIPLEPELLSAVNPSSRVAITSNRNLPEELLQPVKEICAIARLAVEKQKQSAEKAARPPRKRAGSSSAVSKKKLLRHGKIIESALELLRPEPQSNVDAREEAYASNYFQKVKSILSGNQFTQFCAFLEQLENVERNVSKTFADLSVLLAPHPELLEDLIPFLTAEQAVECNVFMEHLTLTKMADFLVLLERHFAKTPYQIKRIVGALEKLSAQPGVTTQEVVSIVLPMLKGHSVLTDFFLEMLPGCRPPDFLRTDFDELDEEGMSEGSEEGDQTWERIELPSMPDPYGGDTCICTCHQTDDDKFRTRAQHCIPCSKKFINGKVFIQSGKLLRRGQVTFTNRDMDYHRRRLYPGPVEPRKRKRSSSHAKDSHSPTKTSHLSSDELKSDDDDKIKQRTRVFRARTARKQKGYENVEPAKPETSPKQVVVEETKKTEKEVKMVCDVVLDPVKISFVEEIKGNEASADTVTFLTAWEARATKAQDAKNQPKSISEEELKFEPESKGNETCLTFLTSWDEQDGKCHAKTTREEKEGMKLELEVEKYTPCVDTVTFLTVWEARQAAEARASRAQDARSYPRSMTEEKEDAITEPERRENEPCVDTVTFLTPWEAQQVAEARSSKVQDSKYHSKSTDEKEELKIEHVNYKLQENEPCVDSLTFLTAWEAPDSKNQTVMILEEKIKTELGASRENLAENKDSVSEVPGSPDRKSPPVLSIPETGTIPPGVDPLLSVLEGQPVAGPSCKLEIQEEDTPWKMEEDKVILHTLQVERYCEETFVKISEALPSRSVEDIKTRFQALLNILYRMKAESNE